MRRMSSSAKMTVPVTPGAPPGVMTAAARAATAILESRPLGNLPISQYP